MTEQATQERTWLALRAEQNGQASETALLPEASPRMGDTRPRVLSAQKQHQITVNILQVQKPISSHQRVVTRGSLP